MKDSYYPAIKSIFDDYYNVKRQLNNRNLIMINYPKVIAMTMGSCFENAVSKRIDDFIVKPILSPAISFPPISAGGGFTVGGNAYKKLKSSPSPGTSGLYNAQDFYNLFGTTFKEMVENEYNILYNDFKNDVLSEEPYIMRSYSIDSENPNNKDEFEELISLIDVKDTLNFIDAEQHLMMIKNKRNKVAHNFLDNFSLSVDELREYYFRARLFVKALENVFISQTQSV